MAITEPRGTQPGHGEPPATDNVPKSTPTTKASPLTAKASPTASA
jgi:hypothetical protein